MLTRGDDYPVHQTPEPVAHVATGDRNFYDRYFFNGYARDGELFFAVALGVYPNRLVMDAAVSVVHRGKQYVARASRLAPADRVETSVGAITVQVVEPLRRLRVRVRETAPGLSMEAEFVARGPALEEPRFTRRSQGRLYMDYTRLAQHGAWEGRLRVDGQELELDPTQVWGSRDRSWGMRPVGEPEGGAPPAIPQFFWLWAPLNFPDLVTHFDVNEEGDGTRWHEMGIVCPAGAFDEGVVRRATAVEHKLVLRSGTRHAERAEIALRLGRETAAIELVPLYNFYMSGLGYLHPVWGHGSWHGNEDSAAEVITLGDVDPATPLYLHVETLCEAKLNGLGGGTQRGIGVLEQLILGPHAPSGLASLLDVAV